MSIVNMIATIEDGCEIGCVLIITVRHEPIMTSMYAIEYASN